jgi:hypothetical protein
VCSPLLRCSGLLAGTAFAQTTDARTALQASVKAMGADTVKTIQISAAGWSSDIGQTYGLEEDWPHFEVANYVRTIDYDAKYSREEYDRKQGTYPLAGPQPARGARHTDSERRLRVDHERHDASAIHAPVSRRRPLRRRPPARARAHAPWRLESRHRRRLRRHGHHAPDRRRLRLRPLTVRTQGHDRHLPDSRGSTR